MNYSPSLVIQSAVSEDNIETIGKAITILGKLVQREIFLKINLNITVGLGSMFGVTHI